MGISSEFWDQFQIGKKGLAPEGQSDEEKAAWERSLRQQEADRLSQKRLKDVRLQRAADLAEGKKLGSELFGEGKLGRVDSNRSQEIADLIARRQAISQTAGQRSGDITDVIARRKGQLQGYSPQELQAMREAQTLELGRGQQAAARALRAQQASSGVRGALASAQAAKIAQEGQKARAQTERDLFLQNIGEKRRALDSFENSSRAAETEEFGRQQTALGGLEQSVSQARADELARQRFNIAQGSQEKFGQLAAQLGLAQLGSAERGAVMQQILGQQNADQATQAIKEQGKK